MTLDYLLKPSILFFTAAVACGDIDSGRSVPEQETMPPPQEHGDPRSIFDCEQPFYLDADKDGYGDELTKILSCNNPNPQRYVLRGGDCDDLHPDIHPGVSDTCDGVDQNCDGNVDEGSPKEYFFRDYDGDGHGTPNESIILCVNLHPSGYSLQAEDCNDTDNTKWRYVFPQVDRDMDGYLAIDVMAGARCVGSSIPQGYTSEVSFPNQDCDDQNPAVNPGQQDLAGDGVDSNCDGRD